MPLTVPDQTLAAQVKTPDMMNTLSSIMNIKNAQQTLQTNQLNYQMKDAANQRLNSLRDIAANTPTTPDGSFDNTAYANAASRLGPDGDETAKNALSRQTTQISNKTNQFTLDSKQQDYAAQQLAPLVNDPNVIAASDPDNMKDPEKAAQVRMGLRNVFTSAADNMIKGGLPASAVEARMKPMMAQIDNDPGVFRQNLSNLMKQRMDATGQASAITPSGIELNNGQQQQMFNTNPLAGRIGPVSGVGVQNQLPPITGVMGPNNTPGYLGAQPGISTSGMSASPGGMQIQPGQQQGMNTESLRLLQNERANETNPANIAALDREIMRVRMSLPQQAQGSPSGFVASGLPAGASTGIAGTQDTINKHWSGLVDSAKTAPQDIGVLQNIISHAHGAATGIMADKQAIAQAIAGKLGIGSDEKATTDTNLLLKNSAMLQLAGGDTNLAKTIAGAANPNNHMNEAAIKQAAYQVIGQKQMAIAAQKLFGPLKELADHGTPEAYNQVMQKFNSAADPRIMQLPYMNPDEVKKMKSSMSPTEQQEFRNKILTLQSLGVMK